MSDYLQSKDSYITASPQLLSQDFLNHVAAGRQDEAEVSQALFQIPENFTCPITLEVMRDPVMCADGSTYERTAIETWFRKGHTTSPATNLPLTNTVLVPNTVLRQTIEALMPIMLEIQRRRVSQQLTRIPQDQTQLSHTPAVEIVRAVSDEAYTLTIRQLYQTYLHRDAEPGGLAHWLKVYRAQGRQVVENGIANSDEAYTLTIRQLYQTYLHRDAEPGGLAHWLKVYKEQGGRKAVENGIAGSDEARSYARKASLSK